ncbi:MAG: quinone-dependent dihydroorotate dehydrogenase [Bifidobacteriaceae bacterium]|nr:quinone-dependent dihydroorotate dehydrogenase [Bifidobacteriaceae bacterium]
MTTGYTIDSPVKNKFNAASTQLFAFGYQKIAKKAFFAMKPDVAHASMVDFCRVAGKVTPLMWLLRQMIDYTDPILETTVMGVPFNNPFGLTAGLDKDCDLPACLNAAGFGFETVGSTTSRPCPGNPRPWFHRLPQYHSMVVHAGLANDGSEKVIRRAEKAWTSCDEMRMSVSLARTNDKLCGDLDEGIEDYCTSLRRAVGRTDIIEINVSCPNTMAGEPFTDDPNNLDRLFTALDAIDRPQPMLVKMPLNKSWEEFAELLDVLADHNVQGVSLANLQKDRTGLDVPDDWKGGLSGMPCQKSSDELVARVYREYGDRFVIAGIGGVFTAEDAYRKIRNGASIVQFVSSLMYLGPQNITSIKRGVADLLRLDGFSNVSEAVGVDA